MNQLIGASGEEISFSIYWIIWPLVTCLVTDSLFCRFLPTQNYSLYQAILFIIASVSFAIVFCMMCCCDHVLMKTSQVSNPIKLIFQVLKYAKRHKFPEQRSAFTYWEEECPSRIDLGKSKYGGPFTVEEVENVKTILNLTALVSCIATVIAFGVPQIKIASSNFHDISDRRFSVLLPWYLLIISYLPIYQFLLYPFLYNYIPTMLRRIGCGLVLMIVSHVSILTIEFVGEVDNWESSFAKFWLELVMKLFLYLGLIIAASATLEFTIAQSPCQVRGFVTSILIQAFLVFLVLNRVLYYYCHGEKFGHAAALATTFAMFFLFLILSKRYKLRARDDVIPYNMFAENQFESNRKQARKHLKKLGWEKS